METRKLGQRHLVLEMPTKEDIKKMMQSFISTGKYKLDPRHGYTIDENITHYENINDGERWQGILEVV